MSNAPTRGYDVDDQTAALKVFDIEKQKGIPDILDKEPIYQVETFL